MAHGAWAKASRGSYDAFGCPSEREGGRKPIRRSCNLVVPNAQSKHRSDPGAR
jgi:hypothetical protein